MKTLHLKPKPILSSSELKRLIKYLEKEVRNSFPPSVVVSHEQPRKLT